MQRLCLRNCLPSFSILLSLAIVLWAFERVDAQDYGVDGSIGHIALPTVGRDTGITYFGLFPYVQEEDEQILYGDFRGFLANNGNLGANLTTGFRFLEPGNLFVLGANTSFNFDQTSDKTFQQIGVGLEGLTSIGSITTNFYVPVGSDEQVIQRTVSGTRFVGTQVVVDTVDTVGVAMKGLDASLGFYLPGEIARRHQLEATFGWYHFEGNNVAQIDGFKIQLDGKLSQSLSAQTAITNDSTFGTNVTLGVDWRFGKQGVPKGQLERQLRRFVRRNFNVVLGKRSEAGTAIPLANPITGAAYRVQHVASAPSNPNPGYSNGSIDKPWWTIADAQAAGADIIVVESGTSLAENVVLGEDQLLLGDTAHFQVKDSRYGILDLPVAPTGANNAPTLPPMISVPAGNGVVLKNNSQIAGIMIDSPTGIGILADGVTGFSVDNVSIKNATGNGIEIRNASRGSFSNISIEGGSQDGISISQADEVLVFEDLSITGVAGNGVNITGGHGSIYFNGKLQLDANRTSGLRVSGLETIEQIDDRGTADPSDDITTELVGSVYVDEVNIEGSTNSQGLHFEDNDGFISLANLDITTDGQTALFVKRSDRLAISDGTIETTGAAAVDIDNAEVDIFLKSVSVDGGPFGIGMKQAKGRLFVTGDQLNNTEFSGGVIQNTDVAFRMESSGSLSTVLMKLSGNKKVLESTNSESYFLSRSLVTGTTEQLMNTTNLRALEIATNTFEDNAIASQTGIQYSVSEIGGYVVRVTNNLVKQSPKFFLDANARIGGEFASLNYLFQQNDIQMDKASAVAARMDWIGSVTADISNNFITGSGTDQKGFELITEESNATSTFLLSQNSLGFTAANGVAIDMNLAGPGIANLRENTIEFAGRDGTGVRVTAEKTSRFTLSQNQIVDNAGGATGVLFSSLYDRSNVALDGNVIDLSNYSLFVDRGIIFDAIAGTDNPFITLESNISNTISGASTTFSIPAGRMKGRTIINGQVLQQQ